MKSIIVTGASSGIGKATVFRLLQSGYQVFGLARRYKELATLNSELIISSKNNSKLDNRYFPIEFDITKSDKFDNILDRIVSMSNEKIVFGLVNNAGYIEPGAIEDINMEDLRAQFETNLFGLIGFTKKVLPFMMKKNQGRIVNVSSLSGLISLPLIGAYSATKYALEAIMNALRMELWNTNIKIITINPGIIETDITKVLKQKTISLKDKRSRFSSAYEKYLNNVPHGLPASTVATVIDEAISSSKPKYRYIIGSKKEKMAIRLRPYIPDRILFSQVAKKILI